MKGFGSVWKVSETPYRGGPADFPGVFVQDGIPIAIVECKVCGFREKRRFPVEPLEFCNKCQNFTSAVDPDGVIEE